MRYDVTSKNLAKKIKKDGTTSKVNDIKATYKAGNIIVTYFGEFVSVGVEQIIHISASGKQYKQYMVTLKNSSGIYKMTHNQAHKNKKMPKSAKLEQVVIAGLLPAPKELIDQLVEQVERLVKQYNEQLINDPANYTTRGKLKKVAQESILETYEQFIQDPQYNTVFKNKIDFISNGLDSWGDKNLTKHIYKQLKRTYHPDNVNINSDYYFTFITKKFKNI